MKVSVVSSRIHGYSYSLIACQAAYLATYFPAECWNTAYLRVISGLDELDTSNYGKIAKGIGEIQSHGLSVSLVDINKSQYLFEPDIEHHTILYGMKAVNGLNGEIIEEIIKNRPYADFQDFQEKVECNKTEMISLIKSGAFDSFGDRKEIMREYIWSICGAKKRLTMQNFNALIENQLVPQELDFQKRLFVFNKCLKKYCKINDNFYSMNSNYYDFYSQFFVIDALVPWDRGLAIEQKKWKKMYDERMLKAKNYLKIHSKELLDALNNKIFEQEWEKYAAGTLSSWEIDSVGFYYHDHELKDVNWSDYNIQEFNSLSEKGSIEKTFKKGNKEIPIYKTCRICGTVIAKNDIKSSISLLTPDSGVVNVKMSRDYYARLNQQISRVNADGSKTVMEKSWFKKGTLLMVNGYRQGDQFRLKAYKKSNSYQCYKIVEVDREKHTMNLVHLRYGEEE